jgi:DNA polymerase III alpha subunit
MRKIMGKKKPETLAAVHDGDGEWKGRSYAEMTHRAGISEDAAEKVWKELEGYASYCFNKSHAVAYGIIGFRTLFAKYYAAPEYDAACLRTVEGQKRKDMLPLYINEARRLGIAVHPPDVEKSLAQASVVDGDLYFGFQDVKSVGRQAAQYLVELRDQGLPMDNPYIFYTEFEKLNANFLKEKKLKVKEGVWTGGKSPKQTLGAGQVKALVQAGAWGPTSIGEGEDDGVTISLTEQQALEEEWLDVILTDNSAEAIENNAEIVASCDQYAEVLKPFTTKAAEIDEEVDYFTYEVCGTVCQVEEKRAKKTGKSFGIVTIEFGRDTVEFMVWNQKWRGHKFLFKMRTPGIFTLRHSPAGEYPEGYAFMSGYILN